MGWTWQEVLDTPALAVRDIVFMRQTELEYEERLRNRGDH